MLPMDRLKNPENAAERLKAPLADRLRPHRLAEFVGQDHLLAPGKILDRLLKGRVARSLILWGPPGCGKTSLAHMIAVHSGHHLISMSAVAAGTREIRSAVQEAATVWAAEKRRTWLLMDEIHRLNKAQQDALLPHVEKGEVLLIGATTENPSFEVIRPLLSRTQVLVLKPLATDDLQRIIQRALSDEERGLGNIPTRLTEEAQSYLCAACGGDARILLNGLEMAALTTPVGENGMRTIDSEAVKEALQRPAPAYDKGGEEHFNLISALHKSIRGSDPDAGLYWLARMLRGGEDPIYLARRLVRMAVEDVGLADPFAMVEACAALQAYQLLGSPEGDLALAQAVVYLALAPKSNALYKAMDRAWERAAATPSYPVPKHLRNAPTALLKRLGYGRHYRYPHDHPEGWIPETYLPEGLDGFTCYDPTPRGWEGERRQILARRRNITRQWREKHTGQ